MKTAFIGQRVRIVASDALPIIVGKEATVVATPEEHTATHGLMAGEKWWGVRLAVDNIGEHVVQDSIKYVIAPRLSNLEPILSEGAAPSEYTAEELFDKLGINVEEGETV